MPHPGKPGGSCRQRSGIIRLSAATAIGDDVVVTSTPPDGPPTPSPKRRLQRSTSDRYLGGVAGGVATRFAADPASIRLGLVAVALYLGFQGSGGHLVVLVPYALLWLLLPSDSQPAIVARLGHRAARREIALIAVTMGAAVLLGSLSSFVVLALGGLGVLLLRDRPTDDDAPASAARDTKGHGLIPGRSGGRVEAPKREPALWPITLGLLVVIAVIAVTADRVIDNGLDPRIVIDLALLVVGAVLVLSAWRGRARITLLALVVLAPLWVATSVPDIGRFPGDGTLTAHPTSLPDADFDTGVPLLDYELGYGTIDVDLADLPAAEGSEVEVRVSLTAGRAVVTVPADARVSVDGTIGLGGVEVDAPGHWRSDSDIAVNRNVDRSYPALGTECWDAVVSDEELVHLAVREGLVEERAEQPSVPDVIEAIDDAGFPRPVLDFEEPVWDEPIYDEFGNPISTTTMTGGDRPTVSYWLLSVGAYDGTTLCRPEPPPEQPVTIVITPTIGLGTLEIHRV